MKFDEITSRFKIKKQSGSSVQAICPCHNDDNASLSITESGDKILLHCFAGCDTENILASVGLSMSDLNNAEKPVKTWRDVVERQQGRKLEAVYNYGEYVKLRFAGKKIMYGKIIDDKFVAGIGDTPHTLYNLKRALEAVENHIPVYYVEGEKDVDTLQRLGFTAVTAGGVSDWRAEYAKYFRGAKLIILPDNDKAGKDLAEKVARDIESSACAVKSVITSQEDKGDVTDWFNEGHSVADFKSLVRAVPYKWASWLVCGKGSDTPVRVNADKLAEAVIKQTDYIMIKHRGYDVEDFYIYKNGVYERASKSEFKGYILQYIPIGLASAYLLTNVYNLVKSKCKRVIEMDEADSEQSLINLKNGILDLREQKLKRHTDKFLSTIQLDCNYNPEAKAPKFIEFVSRLCSDKKGNVDESKVRLLQEWAGLLLSNVAVYQVKQCLGLYSAMGNTGKSVFINIISEILGEQHTINLPIQSMSDRFAMGDLYGKRLIAIGDQKADDIKDSSGFKQLTGGDNVKVEFKGKHSFEWKYRGGIVFACNTLPCFNDDKGGHVFERMCIIPCESYIAPYERDCFLRDKLLREKDGIFMWAMEGLYRLRNNRFTFTKCEASEKIKKEYRANIDTMFRFIDENYDITNDDNDRVKKTKFENEYIKWCSLNEYMPLKKRNIKERMEKIGIDMVKSHGDWYYIGIDGKSGFIEIPESEAEQIPLPPEFM